MTNEEAKQQAIKEAWGDKFSLVKGNLDSSGFFEIYSYNPFTETLYIDIRKEWNNYPEEGFYSVNHNAGNTILIRPKSIRMIENNNGWTRLEPDGSNLPNEIIKLVFINTFGKNEIITFTNDRQCLRYYSTRYTHFKVFKPELKPLY